MSWITVPWRDGRLKVKPFWQIRSWEKERKVPVLHLGLILISWWSNKATADYERRN